MENCEYIQSELMESDMDIVHRPIRSLAMNEDGFWMNLAYADCLGEVWACVCDLEYNC